MAFQMWDVEREEFLGAHTDLGLACLMARALAADLAAAVQAQLEVNGEGHRGGIAVEVAVHEAATGLPVDVYECLTAAVPPRHGSHLSGAGEGWFDLFGDETWTGDM